MVQARPVDATAADSDTSAANEAFESQTELLGSADSALGSLRILLARIGETPEGSDRDTIPKKATDPLSAPDSAGIRGKASSSTDTSPAGECPPEGCNSTDLNPTPAWIHEHFRQQQYRLLRALWGKGDVSAADLIVALGYKNGATAEDNLRRRVAETNKGLCEKAELIAQTFEISQRSRDGVLYFHIHSVDRDRQN
jgi:hypothetical protein